VDHGEVLLEDLEVAATADLQLTVVRTAQLPPRSQSLQVGMATQGEAPLTKKDLIVALLVAVVGMVTERGDPEVSQVATANR
jgi:hypothetical protein